MWLQVMLALVSGYHVLEVFLIMLCCLFFICRQLRKCDVTVVQSPEEGQQQEKQQKQEQQQRHQQEQQRGGSISIRNK